MSQKVIVSKVGVDSGTVTNPDDMVFSSDYNTLKYDISGTSALTWGTSDVEFTVRGTVTHGLGYYPFFTANYNYPLISTTSWYPMPYSVSDGFVYGYYFVYAGTNNLIFTVTRSSAGVPGTINFAYKIFKNNLGI
jgi:hypothetical protein